MQGEGFPSTRERRQQENTERERQMRKDKGDDQTTTQAWCYSSHQGSLPVSSPCGSVPYQFYEEVYLNFTHMANDARLRNGTCSPDTI